MSARTLSRAFPLLLAVAVFPANSAAQNSVLMLLPTEDRELEVGGEYTGALSASDYVSADDDLLEAWALQGRAGQSVTLDLLSDAFDARLLVAGPGFASALSDDDGGVGCNARLTVTFLENGSFRVVASSFGNATGTYTLRVSERPGPAPTRSCGEVDPAVLAALPIGGRVLTMGAREVGMLGASSPIVQEGRPGEAWQLMGSAGDRLSVTLESDDFDAYLYLTGPGLDEILTDDDGGGDLDSRIEVTLPSDGPYTVVAGALSAGSFGAYTLRVEEPVDPRTLPVVRTIAVGERLDGRLLFGDAPVLEGRRGQVWAFEATAGESVLVDMESESFDTYLYVVGPGLQDPLSDDDGGDGTNSRLSVMFPQAGTYMIIPSSYASSGTGSFTLSVTPRQHADGDAGDQPLPIRL